MSINGLMKTERPMPRDTRTDGVLEVMILPALNNGGYRYKRQVVIGKRLDGHDHKVDVLVSGESDVEIPISLKWQQTSGTAEQKVPFEILCLAEAVRGSRGKFKKAYLELGGGGWTLGDDHVSGDVRDDLRDCRPVDIVSL